MKKKIFLVLTFFLLAAFLPACSDTRDALATKRYTPKGAEIQGIDIRVTDREILAFPSDDGKFHIDYAESAEEFYDISVSENGILTMVSKSSKGWRDYIGVCKPVGPITLHIPDAALSSLTLCTTRKDISLPTLTVTEQLILSTNGGDISFEKISAANSIMLENKNGDMMGTITGSYDDYTITCTIKKGESNLPNKKSNGSRTLTAINTNGNIDVTFLYE